MKIFTWYYTYWMETGHCCNWCKSYTRQSMSHLIPKDGLYLDNPRITNAFFVINHIHTELNFNMHIFVFQNKSNDVSERLVFFIVLFWRFETCWNLLTSHELYFISLVSTNNTSFCICVEVYISPRFPFWSILLLKRYIGISINQWL